MMDFEKDIAFAISIASKSMADSFNNVVAKYGVTRSQCVAMYYISKAETINQKELAQNMHIRESTMTGLLDRLERDGFIERKVDTDDMRKKSIFLSQKGRSKLDKIEEMSMDFIDHAVEGISEEDQDKFYQLMKMMVESTTKWEKDMLKSWYTNISDFDKIFLIYSYVGLEILYIRGEDYGWYFW